MDQLYKNIMFAELKKAFIPKREQQTDKKNISQESLEWALSANRQLGRYGYTLNPEGIYALASLDSFKKIEKAFNSIILSIKEDIGDDIFSTTETFYKNFPEEVLNKEESELYFNAALYYMFSQTDDPYLARIANNPEKSDKLRDLCRGLYAFYASAT